MAEAKVMRYDPLNAMRLVAGTRLSPEMQQVELNQRSAVEDCRHKGTRSAEGNEQRGDGSVRRNLLKPASEQRPQNNNRSCVHCPGLSSHLQPVSSPASVGEVAALPAAPVAAAVTLAASSPTGGAGPPARIFPAALNPGLAALLLNGNGFPNIPPSQASPGACQPGWPANAVRAASPGQCYNPQAATASSEAAPPPSSPPPPYCTNSCSPGGFVDTDAALAMLLHEEETLALGKQEEEEQHHFQLLQQQEQERNEVQRQQQQQQQQVKPNNQPNAPQDVMALLGTPAEIYEAQYGNGSPDHHTAHGPSPEAAVQPPNGPIPSTGTPVGSSDDALITALVGNPSDAYQFLYAAKGSHAPRAHPLTTAGAAMGEACGTLSPLGKSSFVPCTPQPTPEMRLSCPASPGLGGPATPDAGVKAATSPTSAMTEVASHYTQARPRALDLGVSEEELQQALQAEQQLMMSKAQTPTSPAASSSPSSPTDSYHQELEALVQFFPSISHVELLGVLEAFQGDMMAANDFLIGQQDDAASLKLQQADQDAELARAMHEREEEEQTCKQDGLGLLESELADLLGTEAQELASGNIKGGEGRKGRNKSNSSLSSSCASPPNGVVPSNSANAELDVWRARSIKPYAAGPALQRSSAALAQLELGQQTEGWGSSSRCIVCPGVFADAEAEQAVWQEVEANRNSRRVAILTKWFGMDMDRGLLIDVVNTCNGHLEQARQQLRALGLQEVEQAPPSPSPLNLTSERLQQQQQQQQQQRTSFSGAAARPAFNRAQFVQAAAVAAPHGLAVAAAKQKLWAAAQQQQQQQRKGPPAAGREDCSSEGEGSSLGERCAAEEVEADLDAAFEREWVAMLASGATPGRDDLHARTEVMYRVQRAEADRLHCLRRSAQAAAQRADRKGQVQKEVEMWQHVENLKAKCCAASALAAEKLHAWRNASRVSRLEWDFHCLHVEEALPMLQRNMDAAAILPGRKEVRVITGRGVHSDGEPKLPSAMRDWLMKHGVHFQEHLGYFMVMLDPVNPTSVVSASAEG